MEYDLFPAPHPERSPLSPTLFPGANSQTSVILVNILKDSHERWHCYFNRETKFHNHATLHALALWPLGANEVALNQAYAEDSSHQLPAIKSPGAITQFNWKAHLGHDHYFRAYFDFFSQVVKERGAITAVEEYVFSFDSNFSHGGEHPAMLSRCLGLLFHPLILIGYGIEFNIPGLVVEGLAQAAIHPDESEALLTPVFFQRCLYDITSHIPLPHAFTGAEGSAEIFETLASHIRGLLERFNLSAPSRPQETKLQALSVLARISNDARFDGFRQSDLFKTYPDVMKNFSRLISEYAGQWSLDMHLGATERNKKELEKKLEELAWAYTVLYGLSGWAEGETLNADFVTLHIVTSSLFLFSLAPKLQLSSQMLLLRSHFAVSLAWWIGRGRAQIDIPRFAQARQKELPNMNPANPWFPILQSAIVHPEEHVPKLQRALVHFAQLYGSKGQNDPRLSASEFPGADSLDGSLFLRIAKLTADRTEKKPADDDQRPAYAWAWDFCAYYA